jgi:hypothetical protein
MEHWKSKITEKRRSTPFLEFSKYIASTFDEMGDPKIVADKGRTNVALATVETWITLDDKKKQK